jgi:hypothetical protein
MAVSSIFPVSIVTNRLLKQRFCRERPLVIRHRISETDLAISPHSWSRTEPLMSHHVHVVTLAQIVSVNVKCVRAVSALDSVHQRLELFHSLSAKPLRVCSRPSVRPSVSSSDPRFVHSNSWYHIGKRARALSIHSRSLTSFLSLVMVGAPRS